MDSKNIYVDPMLYKYKANKKNNQFHTKKEVKKFTENLLKLLEIFNLLDYKIVLNYKIHCKLFDTYPTIPMDVTYLDENIKDLAYILHEKFRIFLSNNLEIVKIKNQCDLDDGILERFDDDFDEVFIDYFLLLLSKCDRNNYKTSDIIIKNENNKIFEGDSFKLKCKGHDKNKFNYVFKLLNFKEFYLLNNKELLKLKLIEAIRNNKTNHYIEVKENEHSELFRGKLNSFSDIPNKEREFLEDLNKIISLRDIHFVERNNKVNSNCINISKFEIRESNINNKIRIKCLMTLKNSDYQSVNIIVTASEEQFMCLLDYSKSLGKDIIDEDLVRDILKLNDKF